MGPGLRRGAARQPLQLVGQVRDRAPAVELDVGGSAEQRLHLPRAPADLLALGGVLAVVVAGARGDAGEQDVERGAEQHDAREAIAERALVLDGARDDDVRRAVEETGHPGLVPPAVRQGPAVVVGVERAVPAPCELGEERRLPGAGHARDRDPRHAPTVPAARPRASARQHLADPLQRHRLGRRQVLGEEAEAQLLEHPAGVRERLGRVRRGRDDAAGLAVEVGGLQ